MAELIISDIHGQEPLWFIKAQKGIDRLVCLGDYDDPRILEDILDLKMPKIILGGNHDYDFIDGKEVSSSLLKKSSEEYIRLWKECKKARQFLLESQKISHSKTRGIKVVRKIKNKKAAYIHGALFSEDVMENHLLWGRLIYDYLSELSPSRVEANFAEMRKQGCWLLFRGHDHIQGVLSLDKSQSEYSKTRFNSGETSLEENMMQIINPGSFALGKYALFNPDTCVVEFKEVY